MSVIVDLLRHGETIGNGGFRGALDEPLSERGWQQLREAVAGRAPWSGVVSSPLQRCQAFAAELADRQRLALVIEPGLRELDFGAWEGRTAAELMETHAHELGLFWNDPYAFTPPGGEPVAAFEQRVLDALSRLARQGEGHLLLVTHAGVIRLLLARARALPRAQLLQVEANHAQLFRLRLSLEGDALRLEELPCSPC